MFLNQIQGRFWLAGHGASFACAIVVREGNDILGVDRCHDSRCDASPFAIKYSQGPLSEGAEIARDSSGRYFYVSSCLLLPWKSYKRISPNNALCEGYCHSHSTLTVMNALCFRFLCRLVLMSEL